MMLNVPLRLSKALSAKCLGAGCVAFVLGLGLIQNVYANSTNAANAPKATPPKTNSSKPNTNKPNTAQSNQTKTKTPQQASSNCRYGDAAQQLSPFRTSKAIGYVDVEPRALLARGVIPGVGPFTARLFACSHTGADVVLVLDMAETEMDVIRNARKGLNVLASLLMSDASAKAFELELASMSNADLMVEPDGKALAAAAGYSELDLQFENRNGFTMVLFKFYSGD